MPLDGVAFYDWIDYNRFAFSIRLPEWGHIFFGIPGARKLWQVGFLSIKNGKIRGENNVIVFN